MKLQELTAVIEKRYPLRYACDWDNSGLQVGDREQEIKKIYIALDATDEVIGEAVREGAQLILTHHPLLFAPIRQVTTDSLQGRKVVRLLTAGMACYSMHTNYDSLGMAALSAEILGLQETSVLEEVLDGEGIGRAGTLPSAMTLADCAQLVKERFEIPSVKYFGDPNTSVRRAALSPGAGKSMTGAALAAGADVLITGDIDHHTGIDLWDMGLPIIDAGHYGIEHIFTNDIKEYLEKECPELELTAAPARQPFTVV